jgi:DNA-binding FadR family transcriptional regulator
MIPREIPVLRAGRARSRTLVAQLVAELGSRIVSGALRPDDTLPIEADLGRALGASRTVVREAVKSLAAKGLLEPRTRTGTRVLAPAHWNLLDPDLLEWRYAAMPRAQFFRELFELRSMIEPAAAALAARRASAAQTAAIAAAYTEMEATDPHSASAIEADLCFHRAILAASGNELLLAMAALISAGLAVSFRISSDSYRIGLPMHRRVLDAIRERRPEKAREAMQRLLASTQEFLEAELGKL